jgi:hypothetical protein
MAQKGKRLGKSYENFDRNAEYGVDKAIGIVKDTQPQNSTNQSKSP